MYGCYHTTMTELSKCNRLYAPQNLCLLSSPLQKHFPTPVIENRVALFTYILLMTSSGLISCSCVVWSPWFNICYHFQGNVFITFRFRQTVLGYLKNLRQTVRSRWLILCKQRSILPTNSFNFYNFVQKLSVTLLSRRHNPNLSALYSALRIQPTKLIYSSSSSLSSPSQQFLLLVIIWQIPCIAYIILFNYNSFVKKLLVSFYR